MKMNWNHKDSWRIRETNFLVEVTRHTEDYDKREGPNRWAVYAYIYPEHPLFKEFKGPNMWQHATSILPFHCGCSYIHYHLSLEEKVTSIQVGADYHHLHDSHFTHYATKEDASEVFYDAEELVEFLREYKGDAQTTDDTNCEEVATTPQATSSAAREPATPQKETL